LRTDNWGALFQSENVSNERLCISMSLYNISNLDDRVC
jgi:hypothetical protein